MKIFSIILVSFTLYAQEPPTSKLTSGAKFVVSFQGCIPSKSHHGDTDATPEMVRVISRWLEQGPSVRDFHYGVRRTQCQSLDPIGMAGYRTFQTIETYRSHPSL